MDLGAPHRIIQSHTDIDVIRVLSGASVAMSGRRVARLAGGASQTTVMRSLNRLAQLGVLDVSEAGRALMFSINREHLATPALLELSGLRRRLLDALAVAVAALDPPPSSTVLFGSAARADGGPDSDIDLLLVTDDGSPSAESWESQIDALVSRARRVTGNRLSVHRLSAGDIERLASEGAPVIADIDRDGLLLTGTWPLHGEGGRR